MDVLLPPAGKGPGVLVAHAWWGLNQTIRDYGAALAREGFVVGLADLFNGEVTDSIERAGELSDTDWSPPPGERLVAALTELAAHPAVKPGGVAAVGFSYSGFHLLRLARRDDLPLHGVVIHYATGDVSAARVPILVHFAQSDAFESAEDMEEVSDALAKAGPPSKAHTYAGTQHWFAEADRPEYVPDAAQHAFERTVAFLEETLR